MEHGKKNRKFGRETKPRSALLRALAVALIEHGRITTTAAKAKSLRVYVEKLITSGKTATLANTRQLAAVLDPVSAAKLTKTIGPKFADRPGGYIRIRKLPPRSSDGAKLAIIELLS